MPCRPWIIPQGHIKGAVGAGDAFCGGVLYGLLQCQGPQELLRLGIGTAAACLSGEDSLSGIQGIAQVKNLLQHYSADGISV